jgi:hypothetical protein
MFLLSNTAKWNFSLRTTVLPVNLYLIFKEPLSSASCQLNTGIMGLDGLWIFMKLHQTIKGKGFWIPIQ